MPGETNKAVVRRFIEGYNRRDLGVSDELVAQDYLDHTHRQTGREELRRLFTLAFEGFPDWYENVEEMIAGGESVWVRVVATGTRTGEWNPFGRPLPPTGNKLKMETVFIWRAVDGKLVEGREVDDSVDLLTQLGLLEYTATGRQAIGTDVG